MAGSASQPADGGGECLFVDEREIAVAHGDTVATLTGAGADAVVARACSASCRVSGRGHEGARSRPTAPPGSVEPCATTARAMRLIPHGSSTAASRRTYSRRTAPPTTCRRSPASISAGDFPGDAAADARAAVAELAPILDASSSMACGFARACFAAARCRLGAGARAHGGGRRWRSTAPCSRARRRDRRRHRDARARDPVACRFRVQHRLTQAARRGALREARAALGQAHQDRLLHRRVGARRAGRACFPIAGKILEYRELTKLKSTYIDALAATGGRGRAAAHVVQPDGGGDRAALEQQPEPAEHPGAHGARPAHPRGVRSRAAQATSWSRPTTRRSSSASSRTSRGDAGLIDAFTSGHDFHAVTGSRVFGVDTADVTPEMRRRAKAVNFGIVYGQSAHGLGETLKIGYAEAQEMIDRYFAAYPQVREYPRPHRRRGTPEGYAMTMFGRRRPIPGACEHATSTCARSASAPR